MKTSLEFARDTLIVIESIASGSTTANSLPNLARIAREGLTAIENSDSKSAATEASGAAVPDGYVLVPIKPTPKMVDATFNDAQERGAGAESHNSRNKRIYAAMIAAAPAAPEQTEKP